MTLSERFAALPGDLQAFVCSWDQRVGDYKVQREFDRTAHRRIRDADAAHEDTQGMIVFRLRRRPNGGAWWAPIQTRVRDAMEAAEIIQRHREAEAKRECCRALGIEVPE